MSDAVIISIVGGLLGGSAVAAIINAIAEGVRQRRKRRYDKDDGKDKDIEALKSASKWMLFDRKSSRSSRSAGLSSAVASVTSTAISVLRII